MSREKVLRWSGLAAIASGVILIALALALFTARATAAVPDVALFALRLGANILIVFSLMGIFFALSSWAGRLGQAGIVLLIVGILLSMANLITFGWALLIPGLLLCAIACTRSGLGTGPGLWLWLVGASFSLVTALMDMPVLMALGVMISGCGRIWLGHAARQETPAQGKVSRPEATVPAG